MRARDALIVAGVVAIAGFAAADALRGDGRVEPAEPPERTETAPPVEDATETATRDVSVRPVDFPRGVLRGSVVFTDARDCRLRELALAGGNERPLPPLAGDCSLWAPASGPRIAYGVGGRRGDRVPFRFFDLDDPERELGGFAALFGRLTWTRDGTRAAWCSRPGTGFDLELGGPVRRLADCPAAYGPDGEVLVADGERLLDGDRVVLETDGTITHVSVVENGSIAVLVDGIRVQVWRGGRPVDDVELPERLHGRAPLFAPDACAVLFPPRPEATPLVELYALPCFEGPRASIFGRAAAWSPDGEWIAVAEDVAIAFRRVVGRPETIRYPARAAQLAWRP